MTGKAATELSDWTDFQGEAPDGHESKWRQLHCVAPQVFACQDGAGKVQFETLPGILDIYLHEEHGFVVVIAWRLPKSIEANVNLAKWAPIVAGCVNVKQ